jgi:hypothetical protein
MHQPLAQLVEIGLSTGIVAALLHDVVEYALGSGRRGAEFGPKVKARTLSIRLTKISGVFDYGTHFRGADPELP